MHNELHSADLTSSTLLSPNYQSCAIFFLFHNCKIYPPECENHSSLDCGVKVMIGVAWIVGI